MSRGGITRNVVDRSVVGLGGNQFETNVINVAANATISKGTILRRKGNKLEAATSLDSTTPFFVNPFDITNDSGSVADLSLRAIIFGPVRADLLRLNGEFLTDEQNDFLRHSGITPIKAHDISLTE